MPILQLIKPQYCELIASGKKTIEVRKTRPKCELPVKVYIYETKTGYVSRSKENDILVPIKYRGKCIGEYVCDEIIELEYDELEQCYMFKDCYAGYILDEVLSDSCLSYDEIRKYGGDKTLYLWHISNLKIYEKPKKLSFFRKPCDYNVDGNCYLQDICSCGYQNIDEYSGLRFCDNKLTRPPQSFCYVEEATE